MHIGPTRIPHGFPGTDAQKSECCCTPQRRRECHHANITPNASFRYQKALSSTSEMVLFQRESNNPSPLLFSTRHHSPAILSGPRMSAATAMHTAISGAPRPKRPMVVVADDGRPLSHLASAGEPKDEREKAFCLYRRWRGEGGGGVVSVVTECRLRYSRAIEKQQRNAGG